MNREWFWVLMGVVIYFLVFSKWRKAAYRLIYKIMKIWITRFFRKSGV